MKQTVRKIYHDYLKKWRKRKREVRVLGPLSYDANGLYCRHNADFLKEETFAGAFNAACEATKWNYPAPWRTHVCLWAARHAMLLEGDFVECGVWRGFTSYFLCTAVQPTDRRFWLVDSFVGLNVKDLTEGERTLGLEKKNNQYSGFYEELCNYFGCFDYVRIVKGFVPEVLPEVKAEKVAFLHIDMNYTLPEIAAAEYFYPKLASGAIVVLDDYGFEKHIEQKRAFDDFAKKKGIPILSLPTGQGLFIKP